MGKFIPLSIPNFEGNERKYVDDAIDQGWVSTGGAYITKLEEELAKFLHTENVAACQSGTSAIHMSLVEAGVKPGDTVLIAGKGHEDYQEVKGVKHHFDDREEVRKCFEC